MCACKRRRRQVLAVVRRLQHVPGEIQQQRLEARVVPDEHRHRGLFRQLPGDRQQVFEVGEVEGHPYIAMQYIAGGSLKEISDLLTITGGL